jgi:hypothetical protein
LRQYNPKNRYRERAVKRLNKTLLSFVLAGGCLTFGFYMGQQNAIVQNGTLKMELADRETKFKALQDELTTVRAEAQTATSRLEQLKTQYEKDIPQDGGVREIFDMIRKQIDAGMAPERLATIIRSTRPPRNCSDPTNKRFIIKTPVYKGAESTVSVGEGAVIVSGTGASAKNREGGMESWFDPTQPVKLTFKTSSGEVEEKSGLLPLQQSVIANGKEYRFSMAESEKSFVKVTFDSCDYP